MQKHQINIKNSYKKLGRQYINDIKELEPVEFKEFISLIPKNSNILDVGCAGGRDSAKLVRAGFNVVGIDLVE